MRSRILGCAAVLVAVAAVAGQAQATTAPDLYVNVNVTMTNSRFILSVDTAPRGADARFVLHNVSNQPHNFALGNGPVGTGVQSGFSVTVKPGQQKILVLFLDNRGAVHYHGGLPADRNKPGMKGVFIIGPCTHYEQITGVGAC
jgi:hypothetical protein